MHRDRSGSASHGRHSHQSHSSGRSSHHPKEQGRKRHRESRREKIDPFFEDSNNEAEPESGSGHHGGGFEMGVISSGRRMEEESSQWFPSSALQATPQAPPTCLSPTCEAEYGKQEELLPPPPTSALSTNIMWVVHHTVLRPPLYHQDTVLKSP